MEEKENENDEMEDLLEEKENKIKQLTADMKTVKNKTASSYWHFHFPLDIKQRYADL